MERPALKRLLEDIKASKVQIVVVYKVDRLTRSLADFAKIVNIFDAHNASFVSVTQQFNTTTSMGRLTLNMLLSFAQFEREIAGEGLVKPIRACGLAGGQVARGMKKISYKGYRFPLEIIQQAIWLYVRFTLSFRDVEDLLAERGIMVSYETVRRWVNHFGPMIAANLRKRRPKPYTTWHLDEVYLKIDGRMVYLWRAVDAEGEVLDVLVQAKRNKRAALKLMRKLLKKYGFVPDKLVTDDLRSYAAAAGQLGIAKRHERGQWRNNRAENSHQPTRRRERKMQGFKSPGSAQKFLSTHAAAYNTFNVQRHLTSAKTHRAFRATAMQTWRDVVAAA
jgi:transposase-like protein